MLPGAAFHGVHALDLYEANRNGSAQQESEDRCGLNHQQILHVGRSGARIQPEPRAERRHEENESEVPPFNVEPHGTDFHFRLDKRPADFSWGLATLEKAEKGEAVHLPAGAVELTAEEQSAEGTVVFDAPVRTRNGIIEQLTVEMEQGRIVHLSAEAGQQIFERYLTEGKGDVDRFGFFGFGLNPMLRHGFTQDDKVLGSVTVGFGDNEDKGGRNRASGHWWACMSGATVTIAGRQVLRDGNLLV